MIYTLIQLHLTVGFPLHLLRRLFLLGVYLSFFNLLKYALRHNNNVRVRLYSRPDVVVWVETQNIRP